MKYILGVDGGNTKTDYFLFDTDGNFIDMYRDGTCSHEALSDSFDGTYRVMKNVFDNFLPKYNITTSDIVASCFGLAGDDIPSQQRRLDETMVKLGFKNFVVVNDSVLGIKAGTTKGYGACSINGTGTSASAIGMDGKTVQIGGIGELTADEGGGRFTARRVVRRVWDEVFRFGEKTSLTPIVFNALGIKDKSELMEAISEKFSRRSFDYNQLTIACFVEANKGDKVARQILIDMGETLGRNAASAIVNSKLDDHPELVLAGSVYVKGACPLLVETVKQTVDKYTNKKCVYNVLQVPPATGAIIWAKELYDGKFPSYEERQAIVETVSTALSKLK